ncbi:LXG domain-containing protein [Bacillus sp. E(2018)]|uniref:ribonuclease YeeF family protein n=1 Tax=Bacillus sp. E(2018) TaxID=2502239 RepID=UPI001485B01D|nr:LXG domain-containing protein [Bacillus sp. E(2018)]
MGSKVYEAPTLKAATKERAQHYEELREQFVGLKKEFGKIVDDGQFQGHGAEAIKGFYQAQSDIVDAWLRFIDVNIEFFKSIPGYAEEANLAENSIVQVPFLEENVSQGLKSAKDRVADQQDSLQNIFNGINDLVSLTVFSKDPFDEQMDQADKKRTRTVETVNAIDQQLTQEYLGLQNLVEQVNELYSAMINATRQDENISPLYFNAEAYKTSSVFQMQSELKTQAAGYVKHKRSERMPSAMKQLSQEAKVYTLKKEKGFFTEIWDNVQSGSGSALDDTVDGLVNMVKNPGETFDGLKYAAAHPIKTGSAAWDQLSTSFNEEVIHGDAGSRAHYFSYMGTQLGVSVIGGKGIDKLSKVSKVDLAKGMGKVKKHTYVVNKKSTAYLEKFNLLFSKERLAADGFTIDLKDFDNVEEELMVLQASKVREVEGKGTGETTVKRQTPNQRKSEVIQHNFVKITSRTNIYNSKDIPSVRDGEFIRWFDNITIDELEIAWANPEVKKVISSRLRTPGKLHEWLMIARAPTFKRWGISAKQIQELRTPTKDVEFINPPGKHHRAPGSKRAHNEILEIIDTSLDYDTFVRRLQMWSHYRYKGGVEGLPGTLKK